MRLPLPHNLRTLALILAVLLVVCSLSADAKRRKRPPRPNRLVPQKIPKRARSPFFRGRGPRGPPIRGGGGGVESKNIFYYAIPPPPTGRPRIILGDELNFSDLGILAQSSQNSASSSGIPPKTSLSAIQHQLIEQSINEHDDIPPRHHARSPASPVRNKRPQNYDHRYQEEAEEYGKPPRARAPKKHPAPPVSVMSSMYRAAGELRNAYKAAIIQSAQVAKLTSHAASRYFKGVRGILSNGAPPPHGPSRGPGYRLRDRGDGEAHIPALSGGSLEIPVAEAAVPSSWNQTRTTGGTGSSSSLPKVHLDWGGSFWKFFYNKSKMHGASLSEAESNVAGAGEKARSTSTDAQS